MLDINHYITQVVHAHNYLGNSSPIALVSCLKASEGSFLVTLAAGGQAGGFFSDSQVVRYSIRGGPRSVWRARRHNMNIRCENESGSYKHDFYNFPWGFRS